MKPIGTIPYFLAAPRRRLRARSRAASSSKATWLKRASALRTCDSSLIGRRLRPLESTYANALLGSFARFLASSWLMALADGLDGAVTILHPPKQHRRSGAAGSRRTTVQTHQRREPIAALPPIHTEREQGIARHAAEDRIAGTHVQRAAGDHGAGAIQ